MSFTAPLWLLLLGLLPVIVALHAIAVRWRSMPVSSLVFWDDILKDRRASLRLRRLLRSLVLALQLLAVAGLSLALAGPRVTRHGLAGAGDTILVLDATASMQAREGARTRFDLARAKARDVLAGLRRGSRMALVIAERAPRLAVPFTEDRAALSRALDDAAPTDEPGDVGLSVDFAASLRDARRDDQVVLVSDGAYDEVGTVDPSLPWVHLVLVGTQRENVGITGLAFRRSIQGEESYELFISLANTGTRASAFPLTVSAGTATVISRSVSLAAGARTTFSLPWTGPTVGRIEARIQPDDDFPVDDRAYAVFTPARSLRVRVVGASTYFIQRALSSLPGVTVQATAAPPALGAADTTTADVTVFDDVDPPPLSRGAFIVFAGVPPDLPLTANGALSVPPVTGWARSDPLLDSVSLSGVAIGAALDLRAGPGFSVLASSHAAPLLLSWDHGGLKAIVAAFDPEKSDFPLRPAFPVFIANALSWFFPSWLVVQADQVPAGLPRTIPAEDGESVSVEGPNGATAALTGENGSAEFFDTRLAGFYTVRTAAGTSEFAVNLTDADESDITPRFVIPTPGSGAGPAATAGAAVSVWAVFAAIALALLLLEWAAWLRTAREGR